MHFTWAEFLLEWITHTNPNDNITSAILNTHANSDNLQILTFI